MKKSKLLLTALSLFLFTSNVSSVSATEKYGIEIEDTLTLTNIPKTYKNDAKAQMLLDYYKQTFREAGYSGDNVELIKTGNKGLDMFVLDISVVDESFDSMFQEVVNGTERGLYFWKNIATPSYLMLSQDIQENIGDYYALGIKATVNGEPEIIGIYWRGLVLEDSLDPENAYNDLDKIAQQR